MNTKKSVLVVTAHPDDEAFGPSGLIAKISGVYDVHLVCVTDGASDSRFHPMGAALAPLRKAELEKSAAILGVKQIHFLNYQDGTLCNNLYHEIAEKITKIAEAISPTCIVTMENRGVSGHLDHVAVSMISSFVYRNMKSIDAILYHVAPKAASDMMQEYFIYFPPGFEKKDVDLVVDISDVLDKKIAAAKCHETQADDVKRVTTRWQTAPKEELYLVTKRSETFSIVG
jgi:LmbE family N-acetylglucosaminyl deacetylase